MAMHRRRRPLPEARIPFACGRGTATNTPFQYQAQHHQTWRHDVTTPPIRHSTAWVNFTLLSFAVSVGMMAAGITFLQLDLPTKGFLAMATLMIIQSAITLTKTLRDNQEVEKLVSKVEEAKTERILMGVREGKSD
jgi:hypothetical protein